MYLYPPTRTPLYHRVDLPVWLTLSDYGKQFQFYGIRLPAAGTVETNGNSHPLLNIYCNVCNLPAHANYMCFFTIICFGKWRLIENSLKNCTFWQGPNTSVYTRINKTVERNFFSLLVCLFVILLSLRLSTSLLPIYKSIYNLAPSNLLLNASVSILQFKFNGGWAFSVAGPATWGHSAVCHPGSINI